MEKQKTYRAFIEVLHSSNVGHYIELPQIAVMGDTSAGKSSLLSAVCGIEFPANDALTTRCPARVRLEKCEEEFTTVGIKWIMEKRDCWEVRRFKAGDLDGIKSAIAAAQACILDKSGLTDCASDIIEIAVYGPDCVNLTLIDLPGYVKTTGEAESEALGVEIGKIISNHLKNPRCIILAVLPANVDYHNSDILAAAKKVDPEGLRTVPVITKADTIDEGAEGSVLDLLLGKYVKSKLGFHMTKCRRQKQLNDNVTLQESLTEEVNYFSSNEPWCSQEDQKMFGVANLKEKLAGLQVNIVESCMPGVLSEISSIKSKALEDLKAMGEEIGSTEMRRSLYDRAKESLCYSVRQVYQGNEQEESIKVALSDKDGYNWCTVMQHKIVEFGKAIQNMKINNITSELDVGLEVKVEVANQEDIYGKIVSFSDDKMSVMVVPRDKTEARCYVNLTTDQIKIENSQGLKAGDVHRHTDGNIYRIVSCDAADDVDIPSFTVKQYKPFPIEFVHPDLGWLRNRMDRSQNNKLSCFLSADLCENIVCEMIKTQIQPACLRFLETMYEHLVSLMEAAVEHCFPVSFPLMKTFTLYQLRELAQAVYTEKVIEVKECMERESKPFTQNHYLYDCIQKRRNEPLKRSIMAAMNVSKAQAASGYSDVNALHGQIEAIFQRSSLVSMEDHKLHDMEVILDAYGKVATKRIYDDIPMIAKHMFAAFFDRCRETMRALDSELDNKMIESSQVALKRKQLKAKVQTLQCAERAVRDLNMSM